MINLFDKIPPNFFNYLASGSNSRMYSDCLEIIYTEYESEISYRLPRIRIRDRLAQYLLDYHIDASDAEDANLSPTDRATRIIASLSAPEVGWLEEDTDDATYEKMISMTEQGVMLTEFLMSLKAPEHEEYTGLIFGIYNTLMNSEQWKENPYVDGLKNVYKQAKQLSRALRRLATYIKKYIETVVEEESLESLTNHLLEYFDGAFIREYSRLVKKQNIHIYRSNIQRRLEELLSDSEIREKLISGCILEEGLSRSAADERIYEMQHSTQKFLSEDYDDIMREIKHKINIYLQLAVSRARFLRNREADMRGNVEQLLRILQDCDDVAYDSLFEVSSYRFMDLSSLRFPVQRSSIKEAVTDEYHEITKEDIEAARKEQQRQAMNPYSKKKMKRYIEGLMGDRDSLGADELPLSTRSELLAAAASVVYAEENGYELVNQDGYVETDTILMKNFALRKRKGKA